ncbi:hypothetical protein KFE25_004041 [Diacronema lutheri]|uniref:TBCC domain-containing protein 1 n=2 Tax=Diacronema lutheri TaxID=2081491 RepID=A0A8J5XGN4_DIALT|nr:hypothetical protein KFE25_004041 [Diacronema lutheri]
MATTARLAPNAETFEHGLFPLRSPAAVAPGRLLRLGRAMPREIGQADFVQLGVRRLGLERAQAAILVDHFAALRGLSRGAPVPSRGLLLYLFAQAHQQSVVRSPVRSQEEVGDTWPRAEALSRAAAQPSARALAVLARGGRRLGELSRDRLAWLSRNADFLVRALRTCNAPAAATGAEAVADDGDDEGRGDAELAPFLRAVDVDLLGVLLEVHVVTLVAADVRAPSRAPISSLFPPFALEGDAHGDGGPTLTPAQLHDELLALLSDAGSHGRSPRLTARAAIVPAIGALNAPSLPNGGGDESPGGGARALEASDGPATPAGAPLAVLTGDDDASGMGARGGLLGPNVMVSHAHAPIADPAGGAPASPGAPGAVSGSRLHVTGVHKRTQLVERAALGPAPADACEALIVDCHGAYIYVLAPVRSVLVLGCTSCTIVLGAVSRNLSIEHCERLRVHAACGSVRIANCIEMNAFLCANRPPILTGENHRVSLAPFNAFFPRLARDLEDARIETRLAANLWDKPVAFSAPDGPVPPAVASLLPPDRFLPFAVPFESGALPSSPAQHGSAAAGLLRAESDWETAGNPCELPREYAAALAAAKRRLLAFQAQLGRISAPAVREEVQAAVHGRFKEWLVKSGHMRQVHDLMAFEPSGQ